MNPRYRRADTIYHSPCKWGYLHQMKEKRALGYSAKEVAESLGVWVETVYRLKRDGKLPSFKVGRLVRFPAAALKAAIKAGYHLKT
jgi:excisionase family DNA binding protein